MLYHFSEQSDIPVFEPRTMDSRPGEPAMVWAIDSFHAPHYFFPRECPRVCIWPYDKTSDADKARFFGHSGTDRIVAVETGWYERLCRIPIYRYTFDPEPFELYDGNAGYYTTTRTVRPVGVSRIDNLPVELTALGIELRITPSLLPLRDAVLASRELLDDPHEKRQARWMNCTLGRGEPPLFSCILLDLDGTLPNSRKQMSQRTLEILLRCIR